jgi:glycosyltransferase involved in cell wall biosynthesis
MTEPNFAINFVGDGYSTAQKIMGRQSAGKSLLRGVARKWSNPDDIVRGFGHDKEACSKMVKQLKGDGFLGKVRWFDAQAKQAPSTINAIYYPAPPLPAMAYKRNRLDAAAYSIFGVTHTLSSAGAMDQISELLLPPFQPWDGLICTSSAALKVVENLHTEASAWWEQSIGATKFSPVSKAVIPLGINAPDFAAAGARREQVRTQLNIGEDEVCFLFSGRMAFHGKANPVAFYQAIEAACQSLNRKLVCIEAGVYPNAFTEKAYQQARNAFAPSARFIGVDGKDQLAYDNAWAAGDVFVSLSDNIQETFGITPLEAMAAGLPVIVSDWDGYKDTVRDGIDGFRIPVILPDVGLGVDFARRHDAEIDTYDVYIGRVSMSTVIDVSVLTARIIVLAQNRELRLSLGRAGQERAQNVFDWPLILDQYCDFAAELRNLRAKATTSQIDHARRGRPDPFSLFAHYPTFTLASSARLKANDLFEGRVEEFLDLGIARFAIDPILMPKDVIIAVLTASNEETTVSALLSALPQIDVNVSTRALMWLAKMGLIQIDHAGTR